MEPPAKNNRREEKRRKKNKQTITWGSETEQQEKSFIFCSWQASQPVPWLELQWKKPFPFLLEEPREGIWDNQGYWRVGGESLKTREQGKGNLKFWVEIFLDFLADPWTTHVWDRLKTTGTEIWTVAHCR